MEAYQESLIETQSQDRHNIYPGKPLRGRKPNKKFPLYKMYKRQPQKQVFSSFCFVSLSPMRYTSERVYVQIRTTAPLFIHNVSTNFCTRRVDPTKLSRMTSPRYTENNILYYLLGY